MSQINRYQAAATIEVARKYETLGAMATSARSCADDAQVCFDRGDYEHAAKRALRSLAYSVGKFSPVYEATEVLVEDLPK